MYWFQCLAVALVVGQSAAKTQWQVSKTTDPMSDKVSTTLVLRSQDKLASLRVTCADDGNPTVLLTVPAETKIETGGMTLAEIRFDKNEPTAFLLEELKHAMLVNALGGAADQKNLSFVATADDAAKAMVDGKVEREQVVVAARAFVDALRGTTRVAFRLPLLASAKGTQGTFSTAGFAQAAKSLGTCAAAQQ